MRFVGIWLAAACAATAANAADIEQPNIPPPVPPAVYAPAPPAIYNWTGFYIGVDGGYGWASSTGRATVAGGPFNGLSVANSASVQGAIAGGVIGFNWQTGPLVLGIEGDGEWSGQSNTLNFSCGAGCNLSETGAIKWLATARARVGYAFDRLLIYGTGGVAWLNATDNLNASAGGITANLLSLSSTPIGFAVGGGVEYAFTNNISARAEYLFMQAAATASAPIPIVGGTITETGTIRDNLVRAGINIRLPITP
jgi:outer membrane immunogenic protein